MLENYLNHGSLKVRAAAKELLDEFAGKKYEEFYDDDEEEEEEEEEEIFSGCDAYVEDLAEIDDSDDLDEENGKGDFELDDKDLPF